MLKSYKNKIGSAVFASFLLVTVSGCPDSEFGTGGVCGANATAMWQATGQMLSAAQFGAYYAPIGNLATNLICGDDQSTMTQMMIDEALVGSLTNQTDYLVDRWMASRDSIDSFETANSNDQSTTVDSVINIADLAGAAFAESKGLSSRANAAMILIGGQALSARVLVYKMMKESPAYENHAQYLDDIALDAESISSELARREGLVEIRERERESVIEDGDGTYTKMILETSVLVDGDLYWDDLYTCNKQNVGGTFFGCDDYVSERSSMRSRAENERVEALGTGFYELMGQAEFYSDMNWDS
ncbi:hypothetical protein [Haliangium ochraceum]|uniref:Lipoprotein n=1 Tax=Haliangium ochraceum (strain DSM 14365 / JCM 11303 / SMP-2) TaxID=502025 RepID=D0LML3_HALO1|nr:hypothetical protein [Haliangium ochraceum]ACY18700.1 hypothetical protein Hoch_6226 [Haliangium ochraceum DSM 14365]